MASPKKNVAYNFDIALVDTADTGSFKVNPTIAVGDFKVSKEDGALANLATLPVVSPAGSIIVKISLSATEMNKDKITVQCIDVAGNEWDDVLVFIDADSVNVDDLATPAQVNTEVSDVLKTDTVTLPGQVAPPLNPTFEEMAAWNYKMIRNRMDQNSTLFRLYADDESTVDAKATVSDDGTIAVKQELVAGP